MYYRQYFWCRNTNKIALFLLTGCSLISFGGCGLVSIPTMNQYPCKQLQKVIVLDPDDGKPISDATVCFSYWKWDNWFLPYPYCVIKDNTTHEKLIKEYPFTQDDVISSWQAEYTENGVYEFESQNKWSWTTIWCPWPPVLGCFLYHTYERALVVSSNGYKTIVIGNHLNSKNDICCSVEEQITENCIEFKDGYTLIKLPKK